MAHTDHHAPARLWSRINPDLSDGVYWRPRLWRCMSSHRAKESLAKDVRAANRRARRIARGQLRRGIEPAPEQHRHNAVWEIY